MKNKTSILTILALLVAITLIGCINGDTPTDQNQRIIENSFASTISVLTIESCEYVWVSVGHAGGLSHKGNCKFCIERNKK
jgi:outer membrane lipoprotein SlyB